MKVSIILKKKYGPQLHYQYSKTRASGQELNQKPVVLIFGMTVLLLDFLYI